VNRAFTWLLSAVLILMTAGSILAFTGFESDDLDAPLRLPAVGAAELRIIKPDLLEVNLVTTKAPPPARVTQWNFVAANFQYVLPPAGKFQVTANGSPIPVQSVGFKRRPFYAAFRQRDLRIGNQLYLKLAQPVNDGQQITVTNPDGTLWSATSVQYVTTFDARRYSPAIHVNQNGYLPGYSKKAMVGYYLGTMGELEIPAGKGFQLIDAQSANVVHQGTLALRRDVGYDYTPLPYQGVYEADFSAFNTPGEYRLLIPDLGVSYPFRIDDAVAALTARTYALGIYHQRCGAANALPFTRHTHDACHTAAAEVPNDSFGAVNKALADFSADFAKNPRHTAPQLKKVSAGLYPFVNTGRVDVSGGHHDAGDYSKYTINSAQFVHHLIFAIDNFPGVAALDNLGIPESGDGVSDLLEEAKWETDFLAKMQDADGGFYFLVYPRNRSYEDNVLPDRGDPQVVFPKTTAATAAAVAALAQAASSPAFKQAFPQSSADYLAKAKKGWEFLQGAFAKFGRDGAYQKISHYGDDFMHEDEVAWAATELFLATGDHSFENELVSKYDPSNRQFLAQGWIRMWEGYGAAVRSYAFGVRSGRVAPGALNAGFLGKCETDLFTAAAEQVRFSAQTAYGSSFPDPHKHFHTAGWYFSVNQTYDLAVADLLEVSAERTDTILLNMNYEGGCNPVNVSFVTGLGYKRQREMTHQYATNDRRILPPSGLPLGNIQRGYQTDLPLYPNELSGLSFPPDQATAAAYAPYDIWGDAFNVTTEFVNPQQARSLAVTASLMAKTPLKTQPWKTPNARIELTASNVEVGDSATATLHCDDLDLAQAQVVWEARTQEPHMASELELTPGFVGRYWIEAEALLPDGRRVAATGELISGAAAPKITGVSAQTVRISGTVGQSFVIEASGDLINWIAIGNGTFTSESQEWSDQFGTDLSVRFYRVATGQ
jgi:hypothetical protein